MRLDLEEDLWRSLRLYDGPGIAPREWAERAIADGRIVSGKQVIATLRKWGEDYEYGVSEWLGWRTAETSETLERRRAEEDAIARKRAKLIAIGMQSIPVDALTPYRASVRYADEIARRASEVVMLDPVLSAITAHYLRERADQRMRDHVAAETDPCR